MNKMLGGVVALALTVSFTGANATLRTSPATDPNAMLRTSLTRVFANGRHAGSAVVNTGIAWKKTVGVSAVAAIIWYAACNALKNMGDKTETTFTVLGQKITLSKTNLKDIVFGSKVVLGLVLVYVGREVFMKPRYLQSYRERLGRVDSAVPGVDDAAHVAALDAANAARDRTLLEWFSGVPRANDLASA